MAGSGKFFGAPRETFSHPAFSLGGEGFGCCEVKFCGGMYADGVSNAAITSSRKPNRAVAEAKEFPGTVRGAGGWRESGQGRHTRLGVDDAFFRALFTSCALGAGGRSGTLHYYSCMRAVGVCAAGRRWRPQERPVRSPPGDRRFWPLLAHWRPPGRWRGPWWPSPQPLRRRPEEEPGRPLWCPTRPKRRLGQTGGPWSGKPLIAGTFATPRS